MFARHDRQVYDIHGQVMSSGPYYRRSFRHTINGDLAKIAKDAKKTGNSCQKDIGQWVRILNYILVSSLRSQAQQAL